MKYLLSFNTILAVTFLLLWGCKKEGTETLTMEIISCTAGTVALNSYSPTLNVPFNQDFILTFSTAVDSNSVQNSISFKDENNAVVPNTFFRFANGYKTVIVKLYRDLNLGKSYTLMVAKTLRGSKGEIFKGTQYPFTTTNGIFLLNAISLNNSNFTAPLHIFSVPPQSHSIRLEFSEAVDTSQLKSKFTCSGNSIYSVSLSNGNKTVQLQSTGKLSSYMQYDFAISSSLRSVFGNKFAGFTNWFQTGLDSTFKFPEITDDELLTLVQRNTFRYFYDFAHPASGMARERNTSGNTVTTGGSGFGVMALVVGMERGFITRSQGLAQLTKIVSFLETADRFHGAWSHWIDGNTGKVIPFGDNDNGGDLVETAFMAQGLITMRQYLNPSVSAEKTLIDRISALYNGIEWDWYRKNNQNVLYWHWSPDKNWIINMPIKGYNEALIVYVLAASSTTHTIPKIVYDAGWASNGSIKNGKTFYGYTLPLGYDYGGPLFFTHYSFLGLDPRNLSDAYGNYWTQNVNHALINWKYCVTNPKKYPNYNSACWGLTASDIPNGYTASSPTNDVGVIAPTAAISSLPYTPEQSMAAIRYFYYIVGDRLWGDYGFYDAFDVSQSWWANSYLAIDQGPEVCMIENYRTGLLWNLFMSAPEVQAGLTKLGFSYSK